MSSDEREDLEVSDYDMEFAMGGRRGRKQTKNQQIYGIFADDEDDEEPQSFTYKKKGKPDYTSGVSFVAGGTKAGSDPKKEEPDVKTEDVNMSSEEDDDQEVMDPNDDEYERKYIKRARDEDIKAEPDSQEPSEPPKQELRIDPKSGLKLGGQTTAKGGYSMTTLFGMKEKKEKGYAKFASKGTFAERMMAKMGYKDGSGLGKFDQGMINPVEGIQRKRGVGLGAAGTERTKQSLLHFPTEEIKMKALEKQTKKEAKGPQWKVQSVTKKKRKPVYKYRTVDELLSGGGMAMKDSGSEDDLPAQQTSGVKIIDMTGKNQRIITDTRHLPSQKGRNKRKASDGSSSGSSSSSDEEVDPVWACRELEHNLNELCKNSERELLKLEREKRQQDEDSYNRKYEKGRLEKQIAADRQLEDKLMRVIEIYDTPVRSIVDAKETIALLKMDYFDIWREFDLGTEYAFDTVIPLLAGHLKSWDPLAEPDREVETVSIWKQLLDHCYQQILWECWLPPVRAAILNWDARYPEQMLLFISIWKPQIPDAIWSNMMLQLVVPKLSSTVQNWNPFSDPVRVDSWLLPWLPILGKSNLSLMITHVRQTLKSCLREWEAGDSSALTIIKPWKAVWSGAEWDQFVIQAVVPKLAVYLKKLHIPTESVSSKTLAPVQDWVSHVPIGAIHKILIDHFFPKMTNTVRGWVRSPTCVLSNIAAWYRCWYQQLVPELKNSSVIRDNLSQILKILNQACEEHQKKMPGDSYIPPPPPPPTYSEPKYRPDENEPNHPSVKTIERPPQTFKDLVVRRAEQRNLIFMPKGRQELGKELFMLGKFTLFIEKGVCFVSDGAGDWVPTSLTKIFERAS